MSHLEYASTHPLSTPDGDATHPTILGFGHCGGSILASGGEFGLRATFLGNQKVWPSKYFNLTKCEC